MLVNNAVQLYALVAALVLWEASDAHPTSLSHKLCGRKLSDFMSKVCDAFNSPSWDHDPIVVEQPAAVRKKREAGIADQCCTHGCTLQELAEYCSSVITYTELPEPPSFGAAGLAAFPEALAMEMARGSPRESVVTSPAPREVGGGRKRGYGARRRRCGCRGRRRASLMGTTNILKKSVQRAPPVVGTVSPELQWPRTINTDQPPATPERALYYSAVYSHQTSQT